jgi:hypothetical protein
MIISHEHRFIFIHVHRTGGTSIANLIQSQTNGKADHITQHGHFRTPESGLFEKYWDYYTFSFVRNPWERMLSWYFLVHSNAFKSRPESIKADFERFLRDDLKEAHGSFYPNQLDYLTDANGNIRVDKIGRFEHYEDDIRDIFSRLNLPFSGIPQLNKSIQTYSPSYYSENSIEIVANMCKADIDFFGYEFNTSRSYATSTSV